jgi:hypothetical protein
MHAPYRGALSIYSSPPFSVSACGIGTEPRRAKPRAAESQFNVLPVRLSIVHGTLTIAAGRSTCAPTSGPPNEELAPETEPPRHLGSNEHRADGTATSLQKSPEPP